ncbi:MAG: transporter substrate-binding protein [Thermoleophilia bacterium]
MSGATADDEVPLGEAAQMAVEELNRGGGVLGRPVEALWRDGASDPGQSADCAKLMLAEEGACALFGCWSTASRVAVKPVVEAYGSVLFYPMQYEGLEQSANLIYSGSCLNQSIEPGVKWALSCSNRDCFLVGSDDIFPRTANALVRALVEDAGGRVLGEQYIASCCRDFAVVADAICRHDPDIVFSTVADADSPALFQALYRAGFTGESRLVLSFCFTEAALQSVKAEAYGVYTCQSYFSSLTTATNHQFVARYHKRFGESRVPTESIVAAYAQVHLWASIVSRCRDHRAPAVLEHACGHRFLSPVGRSEILSNGHLAKRPLIGRAVNEGKFEIIWRCPTLIRASPWLGTEDTRSGRARLIPGALGKYAEVVYLNWKLDEESGKRRKAERALRDAQAAAAAAVMETQRRQEVAEGLCNLLTILNSRLPLRDLLRHILAQGRQLVGSDGAVALSLDMYSSSLTLQATVGMAVQTDGSLTLPVHGNLLGEVAVHHQAVAVSDKATLSARERASLSLIGAPSGTRKAGGWEAMHAVPLNIDGRTWGVLAFYYGDAAHFALRDSRLAATIADYAALAVENARFRDQALDRGAAAERSRLARELHDSVTQSIFAAGLIAEGIVEQRCADLSGEVEQRLVDLRRLTTGALAEMRSLLLEMRPDALAEAALGELLRHLIEAVQGRCDTHLKLELVGDCVLPHEVQLALYRITQEALSNVVHHSRAQRATVSMRSGVGHVFLRISDDGRGFDCHSAQSDHLGITIMRERAEEAKAEFEISSIPAQGTVVTVSWDGSGRGRSDLI